MSARSGFGKFEVGKIYYMCFQARGEYFVISYLFKEMTEDGRVLMSAVGESEKVLRRQSDVANRFLTWDELKELLDQGTIMRSTFATDLPLDQLG